MEFEEAFQALDASVVAKKQRHLKDIEVAILRGSWQGKKYHEIARNYGYTTEYIKQDVGFKLWKLLSEILGEKVSKKNFQVAIEQRWRFSETNIVGKEIQNQTGWKEAIGVSVFYGRKEELAVLEQWIVKDRCQIVALLGMGGIGKTALAVRSLQKIQNQFKYIIWRSLRNAPAVTDLLADLIQFLSEGQESDLADSLDYRVLRLIHYLSSKRCLLVLARAEIILRRGESLDSDISKGVN